MRNQTHISKPSLINKGERFKLLQYKLVGWEAANLASEWATSFASLQTQENEQ